VPTNETSKRPSRKSPQQSARTALGKRLAEAAREVAAHLRAEIKLREYEVTVPESVDVAGLRGRLGLSQMEFARAFGLDLGAVQAWEQRRRRPDRTARILLAVIAREPDAVMRALAAKHVRYRTPRCDARGEASNKGRSTAAMTLRPGYPRKRPGTLLRQRAEDDALAVPPWVPQAVRALAQQMHTDLRGPHTGPYRAAVRALATERRMIQVWKELLRRQGRGAFYMHPAIEPAVRAARNFPEVWKFANDVPIADQLQHSAAALVFIDAAQRFAFANEGSVGSVVRTVAQVDAEIARYRSLIARLNKDMTELSAVGLFLHAEAVGLATADCERQVKRLHSRRSSSFTVERGSRHMPQHVRGFVIEMAATLHAYFGNRMFSTVARLANVAFARVDVTADMVRGSLPRTPGAKKCR
jgi:putative transcriptional regulator